jgi:anti-sigma-K factor RskA
MTLGDMTPDGSGREPRPQQADQPSDIESLLPWYAAGTLRRRERQRVEEALRTDPELARHLELVREELVETIHLNETLGAPTARAAERLMAAIDTEATRKHVPGAAAGWLTGFFANLSPRTMAVAASFAMLAIALQSVAIVDIFTRPESAPGAQLGAEKGLVLSGAQGEHKNGTFAMVRFARQASAAEITHFLQNYQAALVDGPTPGGLYRVRVAMTSLAKEEVARIVARMRQDHVVETAEPGQ